MSRLKRILITGGAGFIGSRLCEVLLEKGDDVICVDNFFTSHESNVQHLIANPRFELIRHDITLPLTLEAAFEVDEIYNLACPAAPEHYQRDPVKTMQTSFVGSMNMLELAKRCRAKILQASTSEVYGDPEEHPQTESYPGRVNPIGPRACYDEGKRAAETLFTDYHRMHKIPIRIVRIFNTYGPRMHPFDGRVVSNFIRQALNHEPITLFGDGSQTRSFCYRDDLIDGLIRMMENNRDFTGPVNMGNPHEITIRELAELVISLTDSRSEIVRHPCPVDDPVRRRPDITLAQKMLHWKPYTPLNLGLQKTIDWSRSINFTDFLAPAPSRNPSDLNASDLKNV